MTEDNDPIHDLEQKVGRIDTGRASYLMLSGAIAEGASPAEAFLTLAAYYCGMFMSMNIEIGLGEEDEDE